MPRQRRCRKFSGPDESGSGRPATGQRPGKPTGLSGASDNLTDVTSTPPESEFGPALARLFRQAGKPTLRAAAEGMARSGRSEATPQRISDWRNGRHVPRDFDTVLPLLLWLNQRAVAAGVTDLVSIPDWERLWRQHHEPGGSQPRLEAPFPGLASMRATDRDRYFGRDDTIAALAVLLGRAQASADNRIVVVTGISGAGKSSLLGAGLARAGSPWDAAIRRRVGRGKLTGRKIRDGAHLVVVDQFEEVFALEEADRDGVLAEVAALTAAGVVVVLGVRADFFAACVEIPMLARAWQEHSMIVSEMSDEQLRQVIVEPVRLAGGRIDEGLVDLMIYDLHQASREGDRAGRLPLLAHALQVMWGRRVGNRLTTTAYREAGGITSALADTAETTWAGIDPADRDQARALLLALVQFGPWRTPMRNAVSPEDLRERFPESAARIVDAFSDARLLTVSTDSVTFIHDAVMSSWPRMAEWIADDADLLVWRQQLQTDAETWNESGRPSDYLYSGGRLASALEHRDEMGAHRQVLLSTESVAFLDAAVGQQRVRTRLRVGAIALVVLLGLASTITAVIATRQSAALAQERNAAEHSALVSNIEGLERSDPSLAARLLAVAARHYPDDATIRSGLIAAASAPLARTLVGHGAGVFDVVFSPDGRLLATASNDRTVRVWERSDEVGGPPFHEVAKLGGFGDYVTSVTLHPSLPLVAGASGDGTVRLWDIADLHRPRQVAVLHPGAGTAYLTRFSPNGRYLATSSDDGSVVMYRIDGDREPVQTAVLRGHSGAARTLVFNNAGTVLASGSEDQTVRLWTGADTDQPRMAGQLTGFPSITHSLNFLPGDADLVIGGDSANVQIWDVRDPMAPRPENQALPGVTAGTWSVNASHGSPLLAQAGFDGIVHVWNVSSPAAPLLVWNLQKSAAQGAVRMLTNAFSRDGRELAVGRSDGGVDIWSLPPGVQPERAAGTSGLARALHAPTLVSTGTDTRLNVFTADRGTWQRRGSALTDRRANNRPRVAISADGRLAATANNNGGLVELWDLSDPDRPRRAGELRTDTRYTYALDFSPVGPVLAAGVDDRRIQLWDVGDPAAPKPLGEPLVGPDDLVRSASFNDTGTGLAVTADDGNVYVYRLDGPDRSAAVMHAGQAATSAVFSADGRYVVAAAGDLSVWRLGEPGQKAELTDRIVDAHADLLGRLGSRLLVSTATREILEFDLVDGSFSRSLRVSPTLGVASDDDARWVLPTFAGGGDDYTVAGDGAGMLFSQTTDPAVGLRWVCTHTLPLSDSARDRYVERLSATDGC